MSAEVNARAAPALGHHDAIPHPFTTSSPLLGGLDDHSGRPSKRPRPSFLQSHEQPQRADSPEEQYVLLSGVKRWWEGMRSTVQKTEDSIEARKMRLKEVETQLVARARSLEHREAAVTRQEAALAALMPRLQAVARMESAMAALIPHLKVITPAAAAGAATAPNPGSQVVYTQTKVGVDAS